MESNETSWFYKRLGRFTASEIHKLFVSGKKGEIFGVGAMTYIRTKVAELLTMEVKEESDFKQAEWGKEKEAEAVAEFEAAIKKKGDYYGVVNPRFFEYGDYAGGSPDWEIPGVEGADFKCPYNTSEHVNNLFLRSADDLKAKHFDYYCQGQMNMLIRNWKVFRFVSYDPRMIEKRFRLKIVSMYPDESWACEFKERHQAAIEMVNVMIADIATSTVVASYEPELQTMIIT